MKISASLYSNDDKPLLDLVKELDAYNVDYFHIDCNDNPKVFDDIRLIREISKTPIDLHIIASKPSKYFNLILENAIEMACFQYEAAEEEIILPTALKEQAKIGIAIDKNTNINVLESYFNSNLDFGLLMTTIPGVSGGSFDSGTYEKIREFREQYPTKTIHVDGGVDDNIAKKLRTLGVECSVSGSYLVKSAKIGEALFRLKSDIRNIQFPVGDVMRKMVELPIIPIANLSLKLVLETISTYKLGYCLLKDGEGRLVGIITDGDVRNELLRKIENLSEVLVKEMINFDPVVISKNTLVGDAIERIGSHKTKIAFLPVIDADKKILGSISIDQIIQGKS